MVIDAHQHFWRYDPVRDNWITDQMSTLKRDFLPQELLPQLTANGIDGCIAVQADQSEEETMFLLELASQHSQIVGVVGWVDLTARNLGQRLEYFSQFKKLRGFRHIAQSEPDEWFLARADFCRGIGLLKSFNFSYDILIYPKHLPAAINLVEQFPEQRFVLDHSAKPKIRNAQIESWAQGIRTLASHNNTYCKLSGMVTEANWKRWPRDQFSPYLDVVFDAFSPDRLMFGSDWPVCLLAAEYTQVKELVADYVRDLPVEQQKKIFGLNASRFYGLESAQYGSST
jgi:L-fuconolactonase